MMDTPDFSVVITEQDALQKLYQEHDFQSVLALCDSVEVIPSGTTAEQRKFHETFCCKKKTFRFFKTNTKNEIALISYVTPAPDTNRDACMVIGRLKIGNTIHEAKFSTCQHP